MKLLYVEDDSRDADLTLRELAKSAPHISVETVSSIEAALARLNRLASEPLDLVLADVHLRDGVGLSLLNHIRENSLPLAVVIVTGMGDEETAVTALKARADDYVIKHKDYLTRLPLILESALNHYKADAARRAKPLHVLYIENDQHAIENTRRHLAVNADYIQLDVVTNAWEASATLHSTDKPHYDVLLLNFELPERIAFGILREIRLTLQLDPPVVLVCDEESESLAQQSLKLGASSYIVKRPGYLYQLPWELDQAHARADLERREAALHSSEERNRAILNAIPDLMFVLDRNGTYLDFHAKTNELLYRAPSEFLGKNMREVLPSDLSDSFFRCFGQVDSSEHPILLEYSMPIANGTRVFESSMVSCDGDKILAIVRDITERKEAEQSLKKALDEVERLKDQLQHENVYLQEEIRVASEFGEIIGRSEPQVRVLRQAEQVAPLDTTVLILGETGTGKELLAHAIHRLSRRHHRSLVKVNCAALPAPLIESELFGHEKGAFTGADSRRVGRFEVAHGGTIFLDEVGELPLDLQAKLLRALEEGEFERVGGSRTVKVDVRLIAATNRNLEQAVHNGTFRSDLYYRLNIFPITLPPLRERKEDVSVLVRHFVKQLSKKVGKEIEGIPQDAMAKLRNYSWPGNIRELRNVIERAVIITQGPMLSLIDKLDARPSGPELSSDGNELNETFEQHEYNLIVRTLTKVHWKLEGPGGAAELLNIHPSTLRSRMRKLGIERPRISRNNHTD